MSQQLNVVALISGGKDSLYSILHCLKHGHKVVALANLHPPLSKRGGGTEEGKHGEDEEEDMDSYMYQTIGHSIIPLYQEALGIPLYRREITSAAVNTARDYQAPSPVSSSSAAEIEAGDETECLFRLLQDVIRAHPEVNAVSAGAILSTYQRTRIENVAGRLGLIPLAWLWMYPYLPPPVERSGLGGSSASSTVTTVAGLLEDMAVCGCEARIIKVASGGLDQEVLWENVSSRDTRVRRNLVKRLGMFLERGVEEAVLGEGGEYESLALDGPAELWKKKIQVESVEREIGEGGVAFVKFKGAKCVEKAEDDQTGALSNLRSPQIFDDEFREVLEAMLKTAGRYTKPKDTPKSPIPDSDNTDWTVEISQSKNDGIWVIYNLSAPEAGLGATAQMESITEKLTGLLLSDEEGVICDISPDDIVFATILLRSMSDFATINPIYATLFQRPNPPARVTIACGDSLPQGTDILISVIIELGPSHRRKGLHVQSRSYWAPANIGPYSQAIGVPLKNESRYEQDGGLVYIAGQIPLDPASMEIAKNDTGIEDTFSSFVNHTVISLQHLWRVGKAMETNWWLGAVAFIARDSDISSKVATASDVWHKMHSQNAPSENEGDDGEPEFDAWDIKYGRKHDISRTSADIRPFPDFDIVRGSTKIPPFLAVEVDELPRGSNIEWQGLGVRCDYVNLAEDGTEGISVSCSEGPTFGTYIVIGIDKERQTDAESSMLNGMELARRHLKGDGHPHSIIYTASPVSCLRWQGQIVPCRSVWGSDGRELLAAIVVHSIPTQR